MRPRETYVELFQNLLQPGMTVIDGGAHVGLYTVLAARGVGEAGCVIALEPDLYNLIALRRNVGRIANVEIVAEALADGAGAELFYEARSTIGSSLIERDDSVARTVRTTSVDLLLNGRDVDSLLVKLNIEGAEPRAIAGMHVTLSRVESLAIFIEVNPPLLEAAGTDVEALVGDLEAQGFAVEYVDLPSQTGVPLPRPLPKGHLLARRAL
jgi:FkbM family methyltransferase